MISSGFFLESRETNGLFVDVVKPRVFREKYFGLAVNFPDKELFFTFCSSLKVFKNTWLHVLPT